MIFIFRRIEGRPTDVLVRRCDYETGAQAKGVEEDLGRLRKRS